VESNGVVLTLSRKVMDKLKEDIHTHIDHSIIVPIYSFAEISKAPLSLLAIGQLMMASVQLVENSLILSMKANYFQHPESRYFRRRSNHTIHYFRLTFQLIWILNVCWVFSLLLLLFGILTNRRVCILPHYYFSVITYFRKSFAYYHKQIIFRLSY